MTLRYYQIEAIEALYDYFKNNREGDPILALPTGTGKSHVIAGFLQQTMERWPDQRFIMATHVKEIIRHNAEKLLEAWPFAPLGIHSAGLGQRDIEHPIIYGGVKSMYKNAHAFGHRDLLFIDECHLLAPDDDTMYQKFIADLKDQNPCLRVIGLSATPYRLKHGLLTESGLFTDICYDLTSYENFNKLISEGYLSLLIPKQTKLQLDVSDVSITAGEFNGKQLEYAVNKEEITSQAIDEIIRYGNDRNRWLIFGSGIDHSNSIVEQLIARGIEAAAVHIRCSRAQRDERISAFKNGQLQAIVNNNILTTGFDCPEIDLIGVLRPTVSPGLWVQMLGRGTRVADGKRNCLVLDFAGNTVRLGPINDPVIPTGRKNASASTNGSAPTKICDNCGTINHISVRQCIDCGNDFSFNTKLNPTADTTALLRGVIPQTFWYQVDHVTYNEVKKFDSPPMMKVVYHCGLHVFREFICLEHKGYPSVKARRWWREMSNEQDTPSTTTEALASTAKLRKPLFIRVWVNKRWPEILTYSFEDQDNERVAV